MVMAALKFLNPRNWGKPGVESSSRSTTVQLTRRQDIFARYDAAATNDSNRKHWANADHLSPNAANSAEIRRFLRSRARYEVANNSYARGIVSTLANDTVGTIPRLQMTGPNKNNGRLVEREFRKWAKRIGLARKMRTLRMSKAESGEAFAILTTNRGLNTPVKLDVKLIEADQVTSPTHLAQPQSRRFDDGIEYNEWGDPKVYHVMRDHPGDETVAVDEFRKFPASSVIHYFTAYRPGQRRGIPDLTAALPLFAQLRRYACRVFSFMPQW